MDIVLVHGRDVIENVFAVFKHALHARTDDSRQLIAVSRVIRNAIRNGGGHEMAVTILVLQTLAIQSRTTRRGANKEASRLTIACSPRQIMNSLESEHGVEDVERHHRVI